MKRLPKYLHGYADRLDRARYYYKRTGNKSVALPGLPWSPGFMAAYDVAHAAVSRYSLDGRCRHASVVLDVVAG